MADTPDVPETPVEAPAAPEADPIQAILEEGTQDTSKAEPSPAQDKKPEVAEDTVAAPAVPDVPVETEGKPADVADDTAEPAPEETKPQGPAEERKAQLNTEIRDLVSKRNALKSEIEKINSEVYQPATEQELVEQGLSATDAKVEALNQRLEMRDYNERVAEAQLTIESQSQRVLNDFPMFNPESPDYQAEIAQEAAGLLQDALEVDPNTGQVIGSKVEPYKLYKSLAAAYGAAATVGQLKGQQATEQMLARADDTGGSAPKPEAKDPILAILEDKDGY